MVAFSHEILTDKTIVTASRSKFKDDANVLNHTVVVVTLLSTFVESHHQNKAECY